MASQTITSAPITFLDYTDNRRLDLYIASNLPQTQIYNPNERKYSPNWTEKHLILTATTFLDSKSVVLDEQSIVWYKDNDLDPIGTGYTLEITDNQLTSGASSVTYKCKAKYETKTDAETQITFVRVDSGSDGTSVSIKDTAYCKDTLTETHTGELVTLFKDIDYENELSIEGLINGDAYLVQGYLCVYNEAKGGFICTGTIRGPEGKSAKNIILTANTQTFVVDIAGNISPSEIKIAGTPFNTEIKQWSYSINGGTYQIIDVDWISITNNVATVDGATIPDEAKTISIKVSDGECSDVCTIYKALPGQSAPIAFLTNESIAFGADNQGKIPNIQSCTSNVMAYVGAEQVLPVIGDLLDIPEGMTIVPEVNEELKLITLAISVASNTTLENDNSTSGTVLIPVSYPIVTTLSLSWSKINTGATGETGVGAVTFQVYSANGYILSKDMPSIQLQTFAYNGNEPIDFGAEFQWYRQLRTAIYTLAEQDKYNQLEDYYVSSGTNQYTLVVIANKDDYNKYFADNTPLYIKTEWEKFQETQTDFISGEDGNIIEVNNLVNATCPFVTIRRDDVVFGASFMCKMTFNGIEYTDVVTIEDKNDANAVFTSQPKMYTEGDIWVVGSDYIPNGAEVGVVLKAKNTNTEYSDEDWVAGTKYDEKLSDLEESMKEYRQYISLDTKEGITMTAIDENGKASEFSTTLSNTQLSFKQGKEAVAYINNHKMHITEAEVESPLTVTGKYSDGNMIQAPTLNLGNFSIIVESNGSLSIISNL